MPKTIETSEREKGVIDHLQVKLVAIRQQYAQADQDLKQYVGGLLQQRGESLDNGTWKVSPEFDIVAVPSNGRTETATPSRERRNRESGSDKAK